MGYWPSVRSRMAEYWPSSFFGVFMDRDEVEVHKLAKKRTRPISSHLDRTNLVKTRFTIWLLVEFFLRDTAGSSERARWLHLARSGSQSHRAISFTLSTRGASHKIIVLTVWIKEDFIARCRFASSLLPLLHSLFLLFFLNHLPFAYLSHTTRTSHTSLLHHYTTSFSWALVLDKAFLFYQNRSSA